MNIYQYIHPSSSTYGAIMCQPIGALPCLRTLEHQLHL